MKISDQNKLYQGYDDEDLLIRLRMTNLLNTGIQILTNLEAFKPGLQCKAEVSGKILLLIKFTNWY